MFGRLVPKLAAKYGYPNLTRSRSITNMKTDTLNTGDAVTADFRGRKIDGVLAEIRYVRGGGYKYVVAPTDPVVKAKWISLSFRDPRYLTKRKGSSTPAMKKAVEDMRERTQAKAERKAKTVEKRREILEEKGLVSIGRQAEFGVGDTVTIRGTSYNWDAVIGKINYKSGTVGIVRSDGGRASERAMDLAMFGLRSRRRSPRKFRSIPATAIIKATCAEKKVPFTLTEKSGGLPEIKKNGWKQFRFGSEFIERSYVVGTTAANARKGTDYECSSKQVFRDPDSGLFWRETGSFD